MGELDKTARDALVRYRGDVSPDSDLGARNWDRIAARIEAGDEPLDIDDDRGRGWWIGGSAAAAIAAAVVLGLSLDLVSLVSERGNTDNDPFGAGAVADDSAASGNAVVRNPRPAPSTTAAAPFVEPPAAQRVIMPPEPPRPKPAPTPKALPGTDVSSVRAEVRLIRRAKIALRDGDPAKALGLVKRHAREFGDGDLAEERDLLRVRATCDLGRQDDARRLAHSFVRARPQSPLAAHVRTICGKTDDR